MLQETTTTTTYPAWQAAIREAQAIQRLEDQRREAERQTQVAALRIKVGKQLEIALKCFGIEATPTSAQVTIDGITFYLKGYDEADEAGAVYFTLNVTKHLPEEMVHAGYFEHTHEVSSLTWVQPTEKDSFSMSIQRARLADVIDSLNETFNQHMKEWSERKSRPSAPELPEPLQNALGYMLGIVDMAESGDRLTPGQKVMIALAEFFDSQEIGE